MVDIKNQKPNNAIMIFLLLEMNKLLAIYRIPKHYIWSRTKHRSKTSKVLLNIIWCIDREMIFVEPFCYNIWTNLSVILTLCFYSIYLFILSIIFYQEERTIKLLQKLSQNCCTNIVTP